jgi:hypothetical protein
MIVVGWLVMRPPILFEKKYFISFYFYLFIYFKFFPKKDHYPGLVAR